MTTTSIVRTSAREVARRLPGLVAAVEAAKDPIGALEVRRDLRRTWRDAAFLRALPPTAPGAPKVLLPSLFDSVYTLKLELMLATALRLRGWEPVLLVRARYQRNEIRYARAFGVTNVVSYEDFAARPEEEAEAQSAADDLLAAQLTFPAVKGWRFHESWIGPQILSTVSRASLEGAPDPQDPPIAAQIRELLPATLAGVFRARRALEAVAPELVIVNEANYATYGVLVDAACAAAVDVIQVTQPWRDDALMCRRLTPRTRREHPSSLSRASLDQLDEKPWTDAEEQELADHFDSRYGARWYLQARNQVQTRRVGRSEIARVAGVPADRPIAVVFSHILWDANLFYGEDVFDDYGHWLVETVRAAAANPNMSWLIKLHPANVWKRAYQNATGEYSELRLLAERLGPLPDHVRILRPETELSTLSLYTEADVGVTVRGTPGMEMACFGKPVITAGTGRYSGLGFTLDSSSTAEYLQRLADLPEVPPPSAEQTRRAKMHALAVFGRRHWPMRSFRSVFKMAQSGARPLDHNLEFVARSISDIRAAGDLDAWADWAAGTRDVDYLQPDVTRGAP